MTDPHGSDPAGSVAPLASPVIALVPMSPHRMDIPGRYFLSGEIAQTVTVELQAGQSLWAHRGSLLSYDDGVEWRVRVPGAAVSRLLSGEGLAMTYVTARRAGALATLTANCTGKIAVWDLADGPVTCTSGSFLAAVGDVTIEVTVARRFGAAIFGGAGFLLQRVSGKGVVFIHGAGDFVDRRLVPGERLLVSTGNLAAFGSSVGYDIRFVGGCGRAMFGGEGLFMTEMTGPGRVLLQSMKRLAAKGGGAHG